MRINYVLDCADPDALGDFWAAALGFQRGAWRPPSPYVSLTRPGAEQPEMLLQQVAEPKRVKNRMHLDLRVADSDAEVAPSSCRPRTAEAPFRVRALRS